MGKEEERELTFFQYLPGTKHCARHMVYIVPNFTLRFNHPMGFTLYHGFTDLGKSLKVYVLAYTLYMKIILPNKLIAQMSKNPFSPTSSPCQVLNFSHQCLDCIMC